MNSFGRIFRISIFGESHGEGVGVVLDGIPVGIELSVEDFLEDLDRRRSGAKGTTPRKESDTPTLISGVFNGYTTGAPLCVMFHNENTKSGDYSNLVKHPRPSHSDWVAQQKYEGFNDYRGGGHFSGRLTLALVAAGVVAKKMLAGVEIKASLLSIAGCSDESKFDELIKTAMSERDSLGGLIECRASGIEVGLGEPFFDSVESVISHLLFSVPAVKGVEFGAGFAVADARGSQNNDDILNSQGVTRTNNAGGIVGGITNGNEIVVRAAIKPTPSISYPQETFNTQTGQVETLVVKGRHDACIALRASVVVEAAVAIALADLSLIYN
ncbi:MAG: chorismate synthase [Rikenellaceae bacterium]